MSICQPTYIQNFEKIAANNKQNFRRNLEIICSKIRYERTKLQQI